MTYPQENEIVSQMRKEFWYFCANFCTSFCSWDLNYYQEQYKTSLPVVQQHLQLIFHIYMKDYYAVNFFCETSLTLSITACTQLAQRLFISGRLGWLWILCFSQTQIVANSGNESLNYETFWKYYERSSTLKDLFLSKESIL